MQSIILSKNITGTQDPRSYTSIKESIQEEKRSWKKKKRNLGPEKLGSTPRGGRMRAYVIHDNP